MSAATYGLPAAGWFPDPYTAGQMRWWDGTQWTPYAVAAAPAHEARRSHRYGGKFLLALVLVVVLAVVLAGIGSLTGAIGSRPGTDAEGWRPDAAGAAAPNQRVEAVLASTVEVDSDVGNPDWYATGAAVAISETRFLTAQHVVEGGSSIVVIDADGHELTAVVVRQDAQRDLAVLETAEPHGVPIASIATSAPHVGDNAFAIGGSDWSEPITSGVVSGVKDACHDGVSDVVTTAEISSGDSGGPLVDGAGQVIGISTTDFERGDGMATSFSEIRDFLALPDSAFDADAYLVRPADRDNGFCRYID